MIKSEGLAAPARSRLKKIGRILGYVAVAYFLFGSFLFSLGMVFFPHLRHEVDPNMPVGPCMAAAIVWLLIVIHQYFGIRAMLRRGFQMIASRLR